MPKEQQIMYRIVEIDERGIWKTLFHGVNGTRSLPLGVWIKAEKRFVSDNGTPYLSGFHVLKTREQAVKYASRFRRQRAFMVVMCQVRGRLRRKKHAQAEVWLADEMRVHRNLKTDDQAATYYRTINNAKI